MNAISPQTHTDEEERRQRHLSVCQEIIELGMQLTRATAQRALQAAEEDPPHPTPANTADCAPNPTQKPRDPNLAFTRISRIVLQAVTLEAQIAAGAFNRATAPRAQAAQAEAELLGICAYVNRSTVIQGLERLAETHPDRASLHDAIEDAVDESLADHPEDRLPAHFARACAALGLTPSTQGFPEDLVEALATSPVPDG